MMTIPTLSRNDTFAMADVISSLCQKSAEKVREWRRRSRSRRDLMALSNRDLWDIRLTRADAKQEASKPFWQG